MQNTLTNYVIVSSVFLCVKERSTSFLVSIVSASRFGETSCGKRQREVCNLLHHANFSEYPLISV